MTEPAFTDHSSAKASSEKEPRNKLPWQRLSPFSIIFFLGKVLSRLAKDALPGLAPLIVLVANSDDKVWLTGLILTSLAALLILSSVMQYLFFRFNLTDDKLLIKEGVFKKQHRSISFERIQNVNILEPFYFRPFNLVTLQLETAGSTGNEANLAGINTDLAQKLKARALALQQTHASISEELEPSTEKAENSEVLAVATTRQLVQYGLTNNGMFWFFVFLAPFFSFIDDYLENKIGQENAQQIITFLGDGISAKITLVVLVIISVILLMLLFSILGSIFRYHGYTLSLNSETLKRRGGLLNTHEESAKRSKIQSIIQQTNFIGVCLKVENLILKQASGQQKQSQRENLFVIPSRNAHDSNRLKKIVFNTRNEDIKLHAIHSRYCIKTWLMLMLVPVLLTSLLSIQQDWLFIFLLFPLSLVAYVIVRRRWKKYAYGIGEHYGYFQKGFFGFRKTEFPLFKVQRAEIKQSPLQRKRNLATLTLYLASQRIVIPYVPMKHAQQWFDMISYRIETTQLNWF